MIKVPITYTNFDGKEVTEDHYFHLSKNELLEWVSENQGEDLAQKLQRVGLSGDGALIMRTFRDIIARSYGERVDGDSSAFYKDDKKTNRFMSSLAFDQLFEDLILNSTSAAAFVNGLMPAGLEKMAAAAEKAAKSAKQPMQVAPGNVQTLSGLPNPYDASGEILPWAYREPTEKELMLMPNHQMQEVYARKASNWTPPPAAT
jgi:hypothetical protein